LLQCRREAALAGGEQLSSLDQSLCWRNQPLGQHVEVLGTSFERTISESSQHPELVDALLHEYRPMRCGDFGCGRWCSRAMIRGEIGNREVGFMPDAGHDRDLAGPDRSCNRLVVECPQVFQAAAAAGDNDDVAGPVRIEEFDAGDDFVHGAGALDGGGIDADVCVGETAAEDLQEVVDGGAFRRGDDADARRT
jgi:hypothetical protein